MPPAFVSLQSLAQPFLIVLLLQYLSHKLLLLQLLFGSLQLVFHLTILVNEQMGLFLHNQLGKNSISEFLSRLVNAFLITTHHNNPPFLILVIIFLNFSSAGSVRTTSCSWRISSLCQFTDFFKSMLP